MGYKYFRKANYYETDQMGVVHHSNHIRYFEESRIEFMRSIGCDVLNMEQEGIIIPNVDAYARYYTPIRFGDTVEIEVTLARFTGAVMEYHYTARHADGTIAASGHTEHCFVSQNFKPMSLRKKYPVYYNRLRENVEKK